MKRVLQKTVTLLMMVCFVPLAFSDRTMAAEPQYVLRYAYNMPVTHHTSQSMYLFAKLVNEKTNGRVKIDVFPAAQLFADKDMPKAVPEGALDIGASDIAMWTGVVPSGLVMGLCMFYKDRPHHIRFEDSPASEIMKEEGKTRGLTFINWLWTVEGAYYCTKKPILKAEDFKNLKIRVHGEMNAVAAKAFGAYPVFLGGGEVYMALQRGMVDGTTAGASNLIDRKFYEVTKYITYLPGYQYNATWVVMNKKKMDSLPADIQKAILEAGQETQAWDREEEVKDVAKALEFLKKRGQEPYTLPPAEIEKVRNAVKPAVVEYTVQRLGDQGKKLLEEIEKLR